MRYRSMVIAAVFAALVSVASADPYNEGRALYKAGQYREAARSFEAATRENPRNAKAWWQLNFAYNKLGRYADALRAVETAGKLDPSHAFASTPGKYEETLGRLRKKAGGSRQGGSSVSEPSSSAPLGPLSGPDGTISQQLTRRGVFVQTGAQVDVDRLTRVIRELEPVPVRFLIFSSRAGSATLSREADRVRRYLGLRNGYVIACSRAGVAASSQTLSVSTLRDLTREVAPQMEGGDYTGALERLARGLIETRARKTRTTTLGVLGLAGGVAGVIVIAVVSRRIRRTRSMRLRRSVLERQKDDVIGQMNYLDDSAGAVSALVASQARQARLEAGRKLDEASMIMVKARDEYDLSHAQDLLESASADVDRGRSIVDAALRGEPPPEAAAAVPPVYPAEAATSGRETDWSGIEDDQRGACFFCSRPSLLEELRQVSVDIGGERRQVLACVDDYEAIRRGDPPRIRAFHRDGRSVPWYAEPEYDPYRDYYRRGYDDRSILQDFVALSVIDRIFWGWSRPTWGWGWGGGYGPDWGGYTFWPEHHHYHDYYSTRAAGADYGDDYGRDAGGTDFLDSGGEGGSDAGGTDFLGVDQS